MPTAFWIRIVIGLAAAAYLLLAYVFGVSVENEWLKFLGGVTFAVIVLLTAFDLCLWRLVPTAWTKRPKLRGTWKAEQQSTWNNDELLPCYFVIRQTFSTIRITALYPGSRSTASVASITCRAGTYELSYIYWSAAPSMAREGNPAHQGAAVLLVSLTPKVRFEGEYWTDRQGTKGTIKALGHSRKLYDTYSDAARADFKSLA